MKTLNETLLMNNTYKVLTGIETLESLSEKQNNLCLLYNPNWPVKIGRDDVYEILIEYYITVEDYEKCQVLTELKKIKKQA
tara:strand:- start:276 stop:518 length:243 start_codon:yes stop_codon:yes gene_type:complete